VRHREALLWKNLEQLKKNAAAYGLNVPSGGEEDVLGVLTKLKVMMNRMSHCSVSSFLIHILALTLSGVFLSSFLSSLISECGLSWEKCLKNALYLLPIYLPTLNSVIGIILWHIEWHTGLPFEVSETTSFFSTLLTLLTLAWLLYPNNDLQDTTVQAAALLAKNELCNLVIRNVLKFFTRPKLLLIFGSFPGAYGLIISFSWAMYVAGRQQGLKFDFLDKTCYIGACLLMFFFEASQKTMWLVVGGMHVFASCFYCICVILFIRGFLI